MKQIMPPSTLEDVVDPSDVVEVSDASPTSVEELLSSSHLPSYRPTPIAFINAVLDFVDDVSDGRAGLIQRFFSYVFIGGVAALVNLAIFYIVFYKIPLSPDPRVQNVIAYVFACEISIMANFVPNDYFTFRHLAGHQRSWGARCLRFHITSIGGSILTFILQFVFSYVLHIPPMISEAAALLLVLVYNFSFHHIFTYRHVKTAAH